jgi:hypothetical protein
MRLWERLIFQKSKPARTPITDSNPSNPLSHRRNFTTYLPSSIGELQCGRRGTRRGTRKSDHTEYRVPRSFLCVPERFVSHGSTPAVWPNGGTLSSAGGPCVSPSTKLRTGSASWSALRRLASVLSHEARRGVIGFGAFCRNKRASPAGAKPGNTEHHLDTRVGDTRARRSPASACLLATPKMDSGYASSNCKTRTINSE